MQLFAAKRGRAAFFCPLMVGNDLVYVKFIVFGWHLIYNNKQLAPAEIRCVKRIANNWPHLHELCSAGL